jgi:hypothetical protein
VDKRADFSFCRRIRLRGFLNLGLVFVFCRTAFADGPPVGGEVIAVNPLLILAPYLLLIAVVAAVLLATWKGLLAGVLEPLTI